MGMGIGLANRKTGYGGGGGPSNSAPVIDLNGASGGINASGTFTEGDAYTFYLSAATLTDADGDPIGSLVMTCGGQWGDDGADEQIKFDTWATDSDTDKTENLVVGGTTFQLAFVAATGILTVTKSGGGTFPAADGQALNRLFQYANSAEPPTEGDRTFTWVANDGTDNSTAAVLTVTVQETPIVSGAPIVYPSTFEWSIGQNVAIAARNPFDAILDDATSWTCTDPGNLPPGITFSANQFSGTPTTLGTYTAHVKATNAAGDSATREIIFRVLAVVDIDSTWLSTNGPAPWILDTDNTYYLINAAVTAGELECDEIAFAFDCDGSVLDGGRKTVVYDNAAREAVIANNGFETGDLTGWDNTGDPTGSVQAGTFADSEVAEGSYAYWFQVAANQTHYIETSADYNKTSGVTYAVTFWSIYSGATVSVTWGSDSASFTISRDGTLGFAIIESTATESAPLRISITDTSGSLNQIPIDMVEITRPQIHGIVTSYDALRSPNSPPGTNADNVTIKNIVLQQGQQAGYDCAAAFVYGTTFVIDDVDMQVSGNAGGISAVIYGVASPAHQISHSTLRNDMVFISNRDSLYGSTIRVGTGTGHRKYHKNTFLGGPHVGVRAGHTAAATDPIEITQNHFEMETNYTNGFAIMYRTDGTETVTGNVILGNTIDNTTGTDGAGRGIILDSAADVECAYNTVLVRELEKNQEYGGYVIQGVYGIQVETASYGTVLIHDNTVTCTGLSGGTAMRLKGSSNDDLQIYDNTFICDATASADDGWSCVKADDHDFTNTTLTNNDCTTNASLVSMRQDNAALNGSMLLNGGTFTYIDDGLADGPWYIEGGSQNIYIEARNLTYADAGSKAHLKQAATGSAGSTYLPQINVEVNHDITLTFTDSGATPQVGVAVDIIDANTDPVLSATTDGSGQIANRFTVFSYATSTAFDANDYTITTDYGSGTIDTLTLDETDEYVIDLDASAPAGTYPTHVAIEVAQGTAVASVTANTPGGSLAEHAGKQMLAFFTNTTRDQVTPIGWALVGSIVSHTVNTSVDSGLYRRTHQGLSEPATHQFAVTGGTTNLGLEIVLIDGAADLSVTPPVVTTINTQNAFPVSMPAVTPTHDFSLCYRFVGGRLARTATDTPTAHTALYLNPTPVVATVWAYYTVGHSSGVAAASVASGSGSTEFITFSVAVPPA